MSRNATSTTMDVFVEESDDALLANWRSAHQTEPANEQYLRKVIRAFMSTGQSSSLPQYIVDHFKVHADTMLTTQYARIVLDEVAQHGCVEVMEGLCRSFNDLISGFSVSSSNDLQQKCYMMAGRFDRVIDLEV